MAKTFSGKQVVDILIRDFGFRLAGQKESHVKLKKKAGRGEVIAVVPMHKELATGTLHGALKLADVDYKEFLKASKK